LITLQQASRHPLMLLAGYDVSLTREAVASSRRSGPDSQSRPTVEARV
jgi:hypothetical protein